MSHPRLTFNHLVLPFQKGTVHNTFSFGTDCVHVYTVCTHTHTLHTLFLAFLLSVNFLSVRTPRGSCFGSSQKKQIASKLISNYNWLYGRSDHTHTHTLEKRMSVHVRLLKCQILFQLKWLQFTLLELTRYISDGLISLKYKFNLWLYSSFRMWKQSYAHGWPNLHLGRN